MPITDKIAAAKKISELLNGIIATGDFRLRYKIMVDPPAADGEFSHPDIKVELSGADSPLVKERGGELLRAFEHVALEMLQLRLSANHAAERVRESGMPYAFAPMSSRERRIVHLALRDLDDLRTESAGEALERYVVVYPKDYKGKPPAPAPARRRR